MVYVLTRRLGSVCFEVFFSFIKNDFYYNVHVINV